jgi:mRNA interferase MazF
MVTFTVGSVVLIPFPFSDLSNSKLRPAIVIAAVDHNDWILCQVTSQAYSDSQAIEISDDSFQQGSLQRMSYVRPGKLFTAHVALIRKTVGQLKPEVLKQIVEKIQHLIGNSELREG